MSFEDLNLHPSIIKAISEAGYTAPTPIQKQAIPELIAGHDVMASAQTGTGKTAAFMLPALHLLATPSQARSRGPRILVLTPTRELALQVSEAAKKYGKYLPRINVVSILGGMPYPLQNKLLSQPVDILVATPGRLIDHIQRGRIDFKRLQMLVLDEADRMLDMGFIEDVETIAAATKNVVAYLRAEIDERKRKPREDLLDRASRVELPGSDARDVRREEGAEGAGRGEANASRPIFGAAVCRQRGENCLGFQGGVTMFAPPVFPGHLQAPPCNLPSPPISISDPKAAKVFIPNSSAASLTS